MFLRFCCIVAISLEISNGLSVSDEFEVFIRKFNKTYQNDFERAMRFDVFKQTLIDIDALQKADRGTAVYGINEFSDLTDDEFESRGIVDSEEFGTSADDFDSSELLENDELYDQPSDQPDTYDWRSTGFVGTIKNEFRCGSCYAFAPTAAFEIMLSKRVGRLMYLSEQQIVDCTYEKKGNHGCNGGYLTLTLNYMRDTGLVSQPSYPYRGNYKKCSLPNDPTFYKIISYSIKTSRFKSHESFLYTQVYKTPVIVKIYGRALKNYNGGIVDLPALKCSRALEMATHGVVVIGYGSETKIEKGKSKVIQYWIIRDSRGATYGEEGYLRLIRGKNMCGVANKLFWINLSRDRV